MAKLNLYEFIINTGKTVCLPLSSYFVFAAASLHSILGRSKACTPFIPLQPAATKPPLLFLVMRPLLVQPGVFQLVIF
jgi:hypothetical protein